MTDLVNRARTVWVAEGRDDTGRWVALAGYAGVDATEVMRKIVDKARAEGLDVTSIDERLRELGWRIVPYQPMPGWD